MNNRISIIKRISPDKTVQIFNTPGVSYISAINEDDRNISDVEIRYRDGAYKKVLLPISISVYEMQYGLEIYKDNIFVPSWEKGLCCFDLNTRKMLWHFKKHAAGTLVVDNCIIVHCRGDGIYKLSASDATIVSRISYTIDEDIFFISTKYALYGPTRGKWFIIDLESMETQVAFTDDVFNDYKPYLGKWGRVIITDALLVGHDLVLQGFYTIGGTIDGCQFAKTIVLEIEDNQFLSI